MLPTVLKPPEPMVAMYAQQFIEVRGLFIWMALLGFVATGVYRGFKDTRTPLVSAALTATTSLALNYLFIYGG